MHRPNLCTSLRTVYSCLASGRRCSMLQLQHHALQTVAHCIEIPGNCILNIPIVTTYSDDNTLTGRDEMMVTYRTSQLLKPCIAYGKRPDDLVRSQCTGPYRRTRVTSVRLFFIFHNRQSQVFRWSPTETSENPQDNMLPLHTVSGALVLLKENKSSGLPY
jgi:hypothetical protein